MNVKLKQMLKKSKERRRAHLVANIMSVAAILLEMELMIFQELGEGVLQKLVKGLLPLRLTNPECLGVGTLAEILHVGVEGSDGHCLPAVVAQKTESFSEERVNHFRLSNIELLWNRVVCV